MDVLKHEGIGRQSPGLVQAKHLHIAQGLDGVESLHESVLACNLQGGKGIGDTACEEQANRNDANDHHRHAYHVHNRGSVREGIEDENRLDKERHEQKRLDNYDDDALQRSPGATEGTATIEQLTSNTLAPDHIR